tara:strand:- start:46057 stop:46740 length:684 start_codon:yes stop_codon:yes gene_type:complete
LEELDKHHSKQHDERCDSAHEERDKALEVEPIAQCSKGVDAKRVDQIGKRLDVGWSTHANDKINHLQEKGDPGPLPSDEQQARPVYNLITSGHFLEVRNFNDLSSARPKNINKHLNCYGALPNMYYIARIHIARKEVNPEMSLPENRSFEEFHGLAQAVPARIETQRLIREMSVSALSSRLAEEGHIASRHRIGRILHGDGSLSMGDAIGIGRVLFEDERALFRYPK